MKVLDVLQSTTAYFKKRGIDSPRLNAEHLLAYSLGRKRLEIYLEFERDLSEAELTPLRELVRRRGQNEPLQHLLGTIEFCGVTFLCDNRALVPRPETEQLVELVGKEIGSPHPEILDVGTGSGVIALSLAMKFPQADVVGLDISDHALSLARENACQLGMERVQFIRSDLLAAVRGSFDLIIANLPYVSRFDRDELAPEVLRDPPVSLFGGDRGDELICRLIENAPLFLRTGGLLALEIGLGQDERLVEMLGRKNYRDITCKTDYSGVIRFLFARYG